MAVQDRFGTAIIPKRHDTYAGRVNDPGQDLELRLVRYFTAVAGHQHFGRAAAELHIAQPALSRQIQRLEKHLGARLLDRAPQGTRLTPAGQAFHPDAVIATRHLSCRDVKALSDKHVDALIGRAPLPLAADEVLTTPLYEEPRMLVVPRGHPWADRASVTSEELAGETAAPCAFETADWTSYQLFGADVPPIESYEDKLELVANGGAIAVLPVGDQRSSLRPDLVTVPVEDAPPSRVVVVSRKGDPNPMIKSFRLAAEAALSASAA
jgi:DNA-binding transcriptional LysR family regulator